MHTDYTGTRRYFINCIEPLKELIGFDIVNPPGSEKPVAWHLAETLEPMGLKCEVQDSDDNRTNLITMLGGKDGPELMLSRCPDVIPAVGEQDSSPFSIEEKDGKLYGEGICGVKGGVATVYEAVMCCTIREESTEGELKLLSIANEKRSNLGTLSYLKTHERSDYAIIGEPIRLEAVVAHCRALKDYIGVKGALRHVVLLVGEEGAVMRVCRTVWAVENMNKALRHIIHPVLLPPSTIVTMMEGYKKDNVAPGNVRLFLDFRIHPGMGHERVGRFLDRGPEQASIDDFQRTLRFHIPGGEIPQDDQSVKLCLEEQECQFGIKSDPWPFDASCEQYFPAREGIQAAICDPGDIAQIHTVGEFTWEKQVWGAVSLYERVTDRVLYKTNYI